MNADLALPLLGYLFLLAVGVLWISLDVETAYVIDVFTKNFEFVWSQSGRRWQWISMYGWRLLALAALIGACAYLSWRFAFAAPISRAWAGSLFAAMAIFPLCLVPWINLCHQLRYQRSVSSAARRLTPVVQDLASASDISAVLDDAHYTTMPGWSAWHPKGVNDWPLVVPVAYVHAEPSFTVLFPVDCEWFLAWKLANQLPLPGSPLPFNGPGDTTFTFRSVRPLRGVPDWSLVYAELNLGE
ncbi:hypothetical protein Pla175_43980 [Pirellulimonas nuda]|uniref:Transmembrane protein n=1 Tax=Pirellulimonas nuda TaxID=2528009 RepID=A0A518DHM9_9BACT|nr:hypothetical protein [Pirellulimonas nuda]QDU90983.1 hypothetical protein Pla175_43980 [Pirellulimonas nuda]